jgi:hypothetical protein
VSFFAQTPTKPLPAGNSGTSSMDNVVQSPASSSKRKATKTTTPSGTPNSKKARAT